ncbi:MAG TPA: hypothetical protein VN829_22715 [Dongiaceae bacterium]|nr:hypothetical protein [Dongiaceae bacterium]
MSALKRNRRRLSLRGRGREWKADMALRHCWFRVLLHLWGMARCPRNLAWHWRHIAREFYAHEPRP